MSWKFAFVLSLIAPLQLGCTSDECTRADDLISACAPPTQASPSTGDASMTLACSGTRLCQATCINLASCVEIEALQCFNQVSCVPLTCSSAASKLATCIRACDATGAGNASDGGADGGSCDAGTTGDGGH